MNDPALGPRVAQTTEGVEWIHRERTVRFTFEGREVRGFEGDTIAGALWAAGQRVLGHSLKKRRPRGLDANVTVLDRAGRALVAEQVPVREGMELRFVHAATASTPPWTDAGSKLSAGGLHDPRRLPDPTFEPSVRRWVGLGRLPDDRADAWVSKPSVSADVLVVGGGPAGLVAALAAAEQGARVLLVESEPGLGGRAVRSPEERVHVAALLRRVRATPAIDARTSTTALGVYDGGLVPVLSEARLTRVRARRVVLATGRLPLPGVFRNNDLPGVMASATAERLLDRYGVAPCRRAVVLTATDEGQRVAARLRSAGIEVAAIVDARAEAPAPVADDVIQGGVVHEAIAAHDGTLGGALVVVGRRRQGVFACDGLIVCGGTVPADQLLLQAQRRTTPSYEPIPGDVAPGVSATGSVLDAPSEALPIVRHGAGACFVDFDEDVELADLDVAIGEGFDQVGLLNAYTKFGRGLGQSKSSHALAARVLADRKEVPVAAVGRPTPRPPVRPVPMGRLAGRRFHPHRRTALHDWHAAHGADFLRADDWERPAVYAPGKARQEAVAREVRLVRTGVGIIDVGTLGKIDVLGRDAGKLLDHLYTGRFADMKIGTTRYALMCDEAGAVVDDGVVARLAGDRFYVTTTTTASGPVYRELQRAAIDLGAEVVLTNVTGSVAAFNVAGPRASAVVARAADDAAGLLACPYLGAIETTFAGVPAKVLRVGFVGEIGYELHVPSSAGLGLWRTMLDLGARDGIAPFGVEAQRMLRLEKGHLLVGQDTDALSTPFEVGLGWAVKRQKPSFASKRSLAIRAAQPLSRVLVGFAVDDAAGADVRECHLVLDGEEITGRVTSVGVSPTLGHVIGLAYVAPAAAAAGAFTVRLDASRRLQARVVPTPFYDPDNRRQRGEAA